MNINFIQTKNMHSCETQLTTVINDWAKILDNQGQVDTFILDFEKAFDTPHMNSLKANCLATELNIDRLGNWVRKWGTRFQPVKCNMMPRTRKLTNKKTGFLHLDVLEKSVLQLQMM